MTLVLLFLITQVVIYLKTKKHLIHQKEGQRRRSSQNSELSLNRLSRFNNLLQSTNLPMEPSTNHNSYDITVHVNSETTNKLEVEAAWTLTLGFVSLLIFSLTILFCDRIYGDCTQSTWIATCIPYFSELILVHTTCVRTRF